MTDILDNHIYGRPDIGAYEYQYTASRVPLQHPGPLKYKAEITAGTAYPDLTIKLPAAPELIAADTEGTFFASDGTPKEVDISIEESSDFMRIGPRGMVLLSEAQTGTCLAKTDKYVKEFDYPPSLLALWNAKDGLTFEKGGEWSYGYAGPQYDSDGESVGAVPAIHYDTAGNLRGVWGGPAYENLLKNSGFAGAVSGTPGTAPTSWGYYSNGETPTITYDYPNFTIAGPVGTRSMFSFSYGAIENESFVFVSRVLFDGTQPLHATNLTSGPTGTTVSFYIDGVLSISSDVPTAGWHDIVVKATTSTTTGNIVFRTGLGCNGPTTVASEVTFSNLLIVKSAYISWPYVKTAATTTTSVVSAAGTSSDNGMYLPLTDALTESLAGDGENPATCTVACLVWQGATSTEVTADVNILSTDNDVTKPLFFGADATIKSSDGTNTASVTVADGWGIDDPIGVALRTTTAGAKMQVGYIKEDETEITWGDDADFTGSFGDEPMRFAYTSSIPIWNRHVQVWNKEGVTEADIIKYLRRA